MKTRAALFILVILWRSCQRRASDRAAPSPSDLVDVAEAIPDITVDLAYAGMNNVFRQRFYTVNRCFLRRGTVEKLRAAQADFGKSGLSLKILDGYRPLSVQQQLWKSKPDARYVAPPHKGSRHNRGAAVDVTLVDQRGRELEMPTAFDDFTEKAAANSPHVTAEALKNRTTLQQIMTRHGFVLLPAEWWHFDDSNWQSFPVADTSIEQLVKQKQTASFSDTAQFASPKQLTEKELARPHD